MLVLLAAPRGFCAGVVRAIQAVETALTRFGAPVYVRRAIVHNRAVVRDLEAKGAIFIEELYEAPPGAAVVLSAHGVAADVIAEGERLNQRVINATCPLVAKVHREIKRHFADGRHVLMIGHAGHPEIVGSLGQLPAGAASVICAPADIAAIPLPRDARVAYAVQTTFSTDEAATMIEALQARFADLAGPSSSDICYATTNRQDAVRRIAPLVDAMIVAGDRTSSNANRLVDVARAAGCPSQLVAEGEAIDWAQLAGATALGVTSAASTPEASVSAVLDALAARFQIRVEEIGDRIERTAFKPVVI